VESEKKVEFKAGQKMKRLPGLAQLEMRGAFVPCKSLKNDVLIELGSFRKKGFWASS
jgi:hypothetical protein